MSVSVLPFSGSTHGRRIKVAATATAGTLIHTATADTTKCDRLWPNVNNSSASPVNLTLEWGGVTDPDDLIHISIPAKYSGPLQAVAGDVLRNALIVRAFAGSANVLTIGGYAVREG